MIRLRVGDLDQWVRFVEPERPEFEVTIEDFLAQMRRESVATPEMNAGSAIHEVLEKAALGDAIGTIDAGGHVFHFEGDFTVTAMPEREGEIIEKVFDTPSGPALLRGRTDARDPFEVVDYKLTFSTFDAERYADSLQWRAYLDMTGRTKFRYVVFKAKWKGPEIIVQEQHELVLWAYPGMTAEVHTRVIELSEFVARHVPALVAA